MLAWLNLALFVLRRGGIILFPREISGGGGNVFAKEFEGIVFGRGFALLLRYLDE